MQFVRQFQTAYADAVSCKIANVFSDKSLQNEGYVHKGFCQAGVPLVIFLSLHRSVLVLRARLRAALLALSRSVLPRS